MDHHILPQFYLRGFRDPQAPQGQVWVADLIHRSVRMRAPRGLACKANYHAVPTAGGPLDQEIETLILQRLDAAAARVFAELRAGNYLLDPDQRGVLALFMALLVTRAPCWRCAVEAWVGEIAAATMRVAAKHPKYFERLLRTKGGAVNASTAELEEIRRSVLEPGNYEYRGTPEASLIQMLGVALPLSEVIQDMSWMFVKPPAGSYLVTSDNPIHWNDPLACPPWNRALLSQKTVLTFPVVPDLCLVGVWRPGLPSSREVPPSIVETFNRRAIQFAGKEIYSTSRGDAEAALAERDALEQAGEPVGPPAPDLRVVTQGEPGQRDVAAGLPSD